MSNEPKPQEWFYLQGETWNGPLKTSGLKDLVKKGDISTKQMFAVLRKFSKTNLLDDSSIDKFVNYMTKVFNDAEYADKISKAYTQLKVAKKNQPVISRKIAMTM